MMTRPDIRSAVTDPQAAVLTKHAKGKVVLELGSWYGLSTVTLGRVAKMVHAVDWHRGDPHAGQLETLPALWANLGKYGVRDRVVIHVGRSEHVLPMFRPGSFDFAFHDAYHATEAVAADARLILPLLKPGALLAFHDYGDARFGVTAAVDALGLPIVSRTGSLVVVRT